jgi:hypothetical protein
MSKKTKKENVVNNSNNLPEVEVKDATQTKGKVSGNFNLVESAKAEEAIEKIDKNQLFSIEIADYFCPIKFDDSELQKALTPLVESGIMTEETKAVTIADAKKKYLEAHTDEIDAANNLTFAEVLEKLQENKTLYNKVLTACKVLELKESNYIEGGKVAIFRGNQCQDKDGNNRYTDCTLRAEENGVSFTVNLFVEYRDITTANILLAIRYYSSKQEAQKKLSNQIADYRRILVNVETSIAKAKENNFSKEQISAILERVFS